MLAPASIYGSGVNLSPMFIVARKVVELRDSLSASSFRLEPEIWRSSATVGDVESWARKCLKYRLLKPPPTVEVTACSSSCLYLVRKLTLLVPDWLKYYGFL